MDIKNTIGEEQLFNKSLEDNSIKRRCTNMLCLAQRVPCYEPLRGAQLLQWKMLGYELQILWRTWQVMLSRYYIHTNKTRISRITAVDKKEYEAAVEVQCSKLSVVEAWKCRSDGTCIYITLKVRFRRTLQSLCVVEVKVQTVKVKLITENDTIAEVTVQNWQGENREDAAVVEEKVKKKLTVDVEGEVTDNDSVVEMKVQNWRLIIHVGRWKQRGQLTLQVQFRRTLQCVVEVKVQTLQAWSYRKKSMQL